MEKPGRSRALLCWRPMSNNFENHHRRSIRLQGYDYSQPGMYFVTIGVEGRTCLFGEVVRGKMILDQIGQIVEEEWLRTPVLRPSVTLDEFIVMPNHFHAVVMIVYEGRGTARRAPTTERFGRPVSGSLPTIVRSFKSATAKRINELRGTPSAPLWQRNYYEHVIRSEEELQRIREYIQTNPLRWEFDRENPARRGEDEFDRWLASLSKRGTEGEK